MKTIQKTLIAAAVAATLSTSALAGTLHLHLGSGPAWHIEGLSNTSGQQFAAAAMVDPSNTNKPITQISYYLPAQTSANGAHIIQGASHTISFPSNYNAVEVSLAQQTASGLVWNNCMVSFIRNANGQWLPQSNDDTQQNCQVSVSK